MPDNLDEDDEEQNSLLKEASRLAHSVSVIYPCGICNCRTDRPLQVFDDDQMDTVTGAGLSQPEVAQYSHSSASAARPKLSRRPSYRHTVSDEPSEDERTSQQNFLTEDNDAVMPDGSPEDGRTPQRNSPTDDDDAVMSNDKSSEVERTPRQNLSEDVMSDDPPVDNGGGSPAVASQREDGEVRTSEGMPFLF